MANPDKKETPQILHENPAQAMKQLIDLAESLNTLLDQEANALILMRDPVALSAIESEKEALAAKYEQSCREFKERLATFKTMPKPQIEKLYALQEQIGEKATHNMGLIKEKKVVVQKPEE